MLGKMKGRPRLQDKAKTTISSSTTVNARQRVFDPLSFG